ncbi:6-hydroxymethylpterin diphosphokinase MptE-like protein [Marinagarivorans algicola]|uniref:motility associated factor glycosyltransferase family protein n=1 Tax=Marinagarivorans algicola TaxID=1513270 RepID=UPI0006B9E62D|nr:6-hydroxymethylpterin diphosphokinase MptE-like protein [Marinagarivorans algicola]
MTEAHTSPEQPSNIQQVLRKAQMQQLQLELEITFKRNMAAFQKIAPQIYSQYIDYQPQELKLTYTEEGYLNLVNFKLNNKPVYKGNPKEFCHEQFQHFKHHPTLSNIKFSKTKISNQDHIHPTVINRMVDFYTSLETEQDKNCNVPIGFMLVTGCGLGYHIAQMVHELDIHNLCIFDPHKDSFYASLHVIDWLPILQKMTSKGRMLKLFIGVEPKDAMADMKLLSDKIGLFNFVYTFVFRHFNSKKETEFYTLYRKEFHLAATGVGFYDDEQISLAHTIFNINQNYKFLIYSNLAINHVPVFLIGNGPSLDTHIGYIQKYQSNAIIITCGTALSSLAKTGIKPDFHIEMERSAITPSYIQHGTTAEYRKGITLICLNTAAPQMTALFDDICLAVKPNDLGSQLISQIYPDQTPAKLTLCNPTVTNAGLSAAITLGFRQLIFLGIDLGMPTDAEHHSSLSIYHDIDKKKETEKSQAENQETSSKNYDIEGNFGQTVKTNPVLHASKNNMEILLRQAQRQGINVSILNPNNGALIQETTSIQPCDLPVFYNLEQDKHLIIEKIRMQNMVRYDKKIITEDDFKAEYFNKIKKLKHQISLSPHIEDKKQLHNAMQTAFKAILNADPISKLLMRGTINSAFTLIMQTLLFSKNKSDFIVNYKKINAIYSQMLSQIFKKMEHKPLECDTTIDTEAVRLQDNTP